MKNTIHTTENTTSIISVLYIKNDVPQSLRKKNAQEATKRFLKSASLLPDDEFLGLQIENGLNPVTYTLKSEGTKVTANDYNWILNECAACKEFPTGSFSRLFDDSRHVYILSHDDNDKDDPDSHYYNSGSSDSLTKLMDFFNTILAADGIIRILAHSHSNNKKGIVFISLPGAVTLKLRTIIDFAFPNVLLEEIEHISDAFTESRYISETHLNMCITGMLVNLMTLYYTETESLMDNTPIENLHLSVRTYNCLKRAGVHSIGQLKKKSEYDLMQIRNLGRKSIEEIHDVLISLLTNAASDHTIEELPDEPIFVDHIKELNSLIGLKQVKELVRKIVAFASMKHDLQERNKPSASLVLNMEFVGNPGTAKTTVARILTKILYQAGLISNGELIEVGRANLVGEYIGHTARNVKNYFEKAKGGVLFIDEAYSLIDDRRGSYGDEAINTIVQEMENNKDDTIVIFAGYPTEMTKFFLTNPGLRSRVPFRIVFEDYSVEEMVMIVESEAEKRCFTISPDAKEKILSLCESAIGKTDTGNGRFCRNLVESAILNYAARVYDISASGEEPGTDSKPLTPDFILCSEDFFVQEKQTEEKETLPFGFC